MTEEILNKLLSAINEDDLETARELVAGDVDLNVPCSEIQGAPPLFLAILKGNLAMVKLLLDHGADPNYRAEEPAASIYAETPLRLAMGARFLLNWDQYHPILQLLENFGAVDEAPAQTADEFRQTEVEARRWQSQK